MRCVCSGRGEPEERGDRVEYAEKLGWGRGWYGEGESVAGR